MASLLLCFTSLMTLSDRDESIHAHEQLTCWLALSSPASSRVRTSSIITPNRSSSSEHIAPVGMTCGHEQVQVVGCWSFSDL